jgi:hypothetical protein
MNARMKKLKKWWKGHWHISLLLFVVALGIFMLVGYRLGGLTQGVSKVEVDTLAQYSSFHAIIDNPLNLPAKLIGWALWHLPLHGATLLRLPSVLFGLAALIPFGYLLHRWYSRRAAILGTVVFACSSWFLHASRSATFESEFLWAILMLLALNVMLYEYSDKLIAVLGWVAGMLALLFIPGMVWLVILNIILQRGDIVEAKAVLRTWWLKLGVVLACAIAIAALGFAIYRTPHLLYEWLGIPADWSNWKGMLIGLANSVLYLIVRGPNDPALWLGRLPILDAFMSAMLIAGILFYAKHLRAMRTRLLAVFFVAGAILAALNPAVHYSILVPIAYIVAIGGLTYILHVWLKVFPRNKLARNLGILVVTILVVASCIYNLRSYFVAWAHSDTTQQLMHEELTPRR